MAVALDTGVAVSAADRDEPRHRQCADILLAHRGQLVMATPVAAETAWMIESRLGPAAEARFLALVTEGHLQIEDLDE